MYSLRKRSNVLQSDGYPEPTIPDAVEEFWIEVKWIVMPKAIKRDPEWCSSAKKKRGRSEREGLRWWPARVKSGTKQQDAYSLVYTTSAVSTSQHDLDLDNEYLVRFNSGGWIYHLDGTEKGKHCLWRNAKWEHTADHESDSEVEKDPVGFRSRDVEELRGCYLELQNVLQTQSKVQRESMERLTCVENRISRFIEPSDNDVIRSFICNALVTGIEFRGKDARANLELSASTSCYRQGAGKVRIVDCSLEMFQNLAREVDVLIGDAVRFRPSKFGVFSHNKRQKGTLSMEFESFHSLCDALRLRTSVLSELIFQDKTDGNGETAVHQIVGALIERSERKHGKVAIDHAKECIIMPGTCLAILRRKTSIRVITRQEGKWNQQSSTCEKSFTCDIRTSHYIADFLDRNIEDEIKAQSFQLIWEPLKNDPRNLMVSGGDTSTPGRLQTVIPLVFLRSHRAVREIEEIIEKSGQSFIENGGCDVEEFASELKRNQITDSIKFKKID